MTMELPTNMRGTLLRITKRLDLYERRTHPAPLTSIPPSMLTTVPAEILTGTVDPARMAGRYRTEEYITDANLAYNNGNYSLTPADANAPRAGTYWSIEVRNSGQRSLQRATTWTGDEVWTRWRATTGGTVWTPWNLRTKPVTTWPLAALAGLTVGNGTWAGRYLVADGLVHLECRFTLGSSSAITGDVRIGLPAEAPMASGSYFPPGGVIDLLDTSVTSEYLGTGLISASGMYIRVNLVSGSAVRIGGLGPTVPFTWAVGDAINVSASYPVTYA